MWLKVGQPMKLLQSLMHVKQGEERLPLPLSMKKGDTICERGLKYRINTWTCHETWNKCNDH